MAEFEHDGSDSELEREELKVSRQNHGATVREMAVTCQQLNKVDPYNHLQCFRIFYSNLF